VLVKDLEQDCVRTGRKHCLRRNELIGELFELSTPESGNVEPQWGRFPAMELIQALIHDQTQVRVEVADNGGGISAQDIPHIFERFYKPNTESPTVGN
jgi:hypothetical protein